MRKSIPKSLRDPTTAAEGVREGDARTLRADTMLHLRRGLVLDAARAAFFELGLEGVSMREIARRAGYTPGAIYSYFASKEEIYAALLGESLVRLNAQVADASDGGSAADRVTSKAGASFDFYRANPRDLDLGFYLFQGVRPQGLTRELDAHLNVLAGNSYLDVRADGARFAIHDHRQDDYRKQGQRNGAYQPPASTLFQLQVGISRGVLFRHRDYAVRPSNRKAAATVRKDPKARILSS